MSIRPLLTSKEIWELFPLDESYVITAALYDSFPYKAKTLDEFTPKDAIKICEWFSQHKDDLGLTTTFKGRNSLGLAAEKYSVWTLAKGVKRPKPNSSSCCVYI